jgi:DNA-directed RNA polymerase subunit RPC12/RpoP
MGKWISDKQYKCDRCYKLAPAFYTLSHLTQGLWVQCPSCGTHARPYIANLDLPYKPSKTYQKQVLAKLI